MNNRQVMLSYVLENKGNWQNTYVAISTKKNVDLSNGELYDIEQMHKHISLLDVDYPQKIKQGYKPPFALFYEGNKDLLSNGLTNVAIVADMGEKRQKKEFSFMFENLNTTPLNLVLDLESPLTPYIISKHSRMHNLIVVAPYSLDLVDIAIKEQIAKCKGLLISEYPSTNKDKTTEQRAFSTRIISGLCDKLLVINANGRGIANVIISYCLNASKDICVIPTEIGNNTLNNRLIYDGAIPVYDSDTLTDEIVAPY